MPTYDKLRSFLLDWESLTAEQQREFLTAMRRFVADLRARKGFRPGLRVKAVRAYPGVYEMTWAPDGRATFEYGTAVLPGEPHVIWRRIGTHDIFNRP